MASIDISARVPGRAPLARPVELACFALIFAHAAYLAVSYWNGLWIVGPDGHGLPVDFVNVWAAGRLALDGQPAAAYDWPVHKAMEAVALGQPFDGHFGWHYPPTFLFAAAALALLPYTGAFVLWTFGTFPAYVAAIRGIVGDRSGYLLAAAFPAVLGNMVVGQNGFLSAGLFGGALLLLERRPVLAGVLIGLLTYKPHLGLLVPLALAAGGHWRAFAAAAATAAALAAAAWATFGPAPALAFFSSISQTSQAFLSNGWADWHKLQTVFGLVRALGGPEWLAWTMQVTVALAAAVAVIQAWRSNVAYAVKAAALVTGALLATPYLYTYDLVVLAVPLAFLFRLGRDDGFLPKELLGMALVCALVLIFPYVRAPVGLGAILIVAGLVVRRARPAGQG